VIFWSVRVESHAATNQRCEYFSGELQTTNQSFISQEGRSFTMTIFTNNVSHLEDELRQEDIPEPIQTADRFLVWELWTINEVLGARFPVYSPDGEIVLNPLNHEPIYVWIDLKNFDWSKNGDYYTYTWLNRGQILIENYMLPSARDDIRANNGHCYIAPNVFSVRYFHAHRQGAICWINSHGEVPDDIAGVLKELGVTDVEYLYYGNPRNEAIASDLAEKLKGSEITVHTSSVSED
jgi:hypothetical protein